MIGPIGRTAVAAAVLVGLAACSATNDAQPSAAPTTPAAAPTLAVVPAETIAGLDIRVEEDQGPGRITYAAVPLVPGADALTDEVQAAIDLDVARFERDTPPAVAQPYPELRVGWELVGASPEAIGVRTATTEIGGVEDDGRVSTLWFDPVSNVQLTSLNLIASDSREAFVQRVRDAGRAIDGVDAAGLDAALERPDEELDAIAFATDGSLYVEIDEGEAADPSRGPVPIVVPADGLLSDFGAAARDAALSPRDPALASASTPRPTTAAATATTTPRATATPARTRSATATRTSAPRPTVAPQPPGARVDCARQKCVALTFDDGPVAGTNDLLDLFKRKNVRATFFVVGRNAAANPAILRRMAAEGHVIGNHTYDHPQLTRLSASAASREIGRVNDVVEKATEVRPTLVRPPYGATNGTVASAAAKLGMAQILWNVDPLDWRDRNAAIVTARVLKDTRRGSIVLSHDIHSSTRGAYAAIVDGLRARGFVLVTVPELLGRTTPGAKYFSAP